MGGLNPDGSATPTQPREKLADADLFGDLPIGVPLVHGQRAEKPQAPKAAPKPEPRNLDDLGDTAPKLYGKIDVEE